MNRNLASTLLLICLLASALILMSGSVLAASVAGLLFVVGGTLLTATVSQGRAHVIIVLRGIPATFRHRTHDTSQEQALLLRIADYHRQGRTRMAELLIKGFDDALLQQGVQLIIDRCSRKDLVRTIRWRIANAKEQDKHALRILQSMVGFAPAFGMLGTLLGLISLLFNLGESGLSEIGTSMGFAMFTTVYGLALANLIIKPVVIKMEHQSRERIAWMLVKYEALLMLHEQQHPTLIRESLDAFTQKPSTLGNHHAEEPAAVSLINA